MKDYEDVTQFHLTKRTPVIIRLDQKSASTWTRGLDTFDPLYVECMESTLQYLMDNIQGAVFGYSVSDEISLFLRDWDKLTTSAWFDNDLQKLVSVSASLATAKFNDEVKRKGIPHLSRGLAIFDSRAFVIPKDEVVNYFIFRQHDGIRNSIQKLGQSLFGHHAIKGLRNNEVKQKIVDEYPDDSWDKLDAMFKYGIAKRKDESVVTYNVPLFKDDRQYIEDLIYVKGE